MTRGSIHGSWIEPRGFCFGLRAIAERWHSDGYLAEPLAEPVASSFRMVWARMSEMMSVMGVLRFNQVASAVTDCLPPGRYPAAGGLRKLLKEKSRVNSRQI